MTMNPAVALAMTADRQTPPLILLVEDEPEIADVVLGYLRRDGLRGAHCTDGLQALAETERQQPDLMLLDIQLPGMDGIDVLRVLRSQGELPVIMLSAFVDDVDRLLGLRLGADDYITKPFVPAEVVARVRAVLRRTRRVPAVHPAPPMVPAPTSPARRLLRHGALTIDEQAHEASVVAADGSSTPLSLTLTEFRLLACLATNPRRVLSRQALIEQCLPESEAFDRVIDSHLSKLRRKLADAGLGDLIDTVRGVGYRLAGEG